MTVTAVPYPAHNPQMWGEWWTQQLDEDDDDLSDCGAGEDLPPSTLTPDFAERYQRLIEADRALLRSVFRTGDNN